jgi:hypothetical protein
MLPESHVAVVTRNEVWQGECASEPYEAGWAHEAIVFIRALAPGALPAGTIARVQISPDGMHWLDEGTTLTLPSREGEIFFARVSHFGTWLRVAASLPKGAEAKILVCWHLKA